LDLGDELCEQMGWKVGDTITWIDNGDGTFTLKKADVKDMEPNV
jgi:bifunctional DNA-binding transcriptional regulator/antitoxin component of YhaV-PrlF toxin-antitoxin module